MGIRPSGSSRFLSDEETPSDTIRVDRTTLPPSQEELQDLDPAEVDKRLRDFGLSDPVNDSLAVEAAPQIQTGGSQPGGRVVNQRTGAVLFEGPLNEARDISDRANRARQLIANQGGTNTPEQERERGRQEGFSEALRSLIQGDIQQPQMGPDERVEGVEQAPNPSTLNENTPLQEGETVPDRLQQLLQGTGALGGESQTQPQPQPSAEPSGAGGGGGGAGTSPSPSPTPDTEQGASAVDAAALESTLGQDVQGSPDIPPQSPGSRIGEIVNQSATPETISEERVQQIRDEVTPSLADRIRQGLQNFGEQANTALQKPEVQRGLSQLAQLFVQPDSSTFQVAQQNIERQNQRIQADQLQRLIEGEDVEAASPETVQAAEEIQAQERQQDLQERRLDIRQQRLNLARAEALNEVMGDGEGEGAGINPDQDRTIDRVMQTVAAQFQQEALQQGFEEGTPMETRIQSLRMNDGTFDPQAVRASLSDETRQQFEEQVIQRLSETSIFNEDQAKQFFQGFTEKAPGGPEESGDPRTGTTVSTREEFREAQQNAEPGDIITLEGVGSFRLSEDGQFVPAR